MTQWPSRSSKLILPHNINIANLLYMLCQRIRKLSDIDFKRFFEVFLNFQSLGVRNLVLAFFEKKSMKGPAWISMSWKKTTVSILCTFISFCYMLLYLVIFFAILKDVGSGWFWHLIHLMAGWHWSLLSWCWCAAALRSPNIRESCRWNAWNAPDNVIKNWLHQMHQAQGCITHVDMNCFLSPFPLSHC